jgi:O-antigen biosynthesis protein
VPARVKRLFLRYAARHLAAQTTGPALRDGAGQQIGGVTRLALVNDRLVVEGRAAVDLVTLELAGRQISMAPDGRGFRLDLAYAPGVPVLHLTLGDWTGQTALPAFGARRLALGRLRLIPAFLRDSARAVPSAVAWVRHRDMAAHGRIKRIMGINPLVAHRRLDAALFAESGPPRPLQPTRIQIIIPVYQAFDLLPEVLDRVARHTDLPWHLILIEDASPDPRIRPFLRNWAETVSKMGQVTLIENPENLGFIGAVNAGLAHVAGAVDAVILLNADALVPAGWASRLIAPILADPTVASVTPMSNDAELLCVPVICAPSALTPGASDIIDAAARRFAPGVGLPEAPTGVGFCMALNPIHLAQVPGFDPAFGRGYGEEVDWCQKVLKRGGKHLCLPSLFVEHRGGASFGPEAKQTLLRRNGAIIAARYPGFDADVQRFIGDDPLISARLALGLVWAGTRVESGGQVPVYLGHALMGGAEHYLAARIARDVAAIGVAVVLRVGGDFRWEIELHTPMSQAGGAATRGGTEDRALMLHLLRLIPSRHVVYSCGVGDADPAELPEVLLELATGQTLEVLFHDYLPLSPSYALLDADGVWRGLPPAGSTDRAHQVWRPDGTQVTLADWRRHWGQVMEAARSLVVFSPSSRALVAAAYPAAAARISLTPHNLPTTVPQVTLRRTSRPVIGVLGNIGLHKGAMLVSELARHLARTKAADLVLLGIIDPAYTLARPARMHGAYEVAEIPALVARYGITCWLIPSIWPETFSYTTHEALATGLPVLCCDLGGQADAVRAAMAAGAPGALIPLPGGRADPGAIVALAQGFLA